MVCEKVFPTHTDFTQLGQAGVSGEQYHSEKHRKRETGGAL